MAFGAALATRGDSLTTLEVYSKGRSVPIKAAMRRGYDSAKGNRPTPKPKTTGRSRLDRVPAWQRTLLRQTRKTTTYLISRLEARTRPDLQKFVTPWGPDMESGGLPTVKNDIEFEFHLFESTLSAQDLIQRVEALGLTLDWFGARNGVHPVTLQRFVDDPKTKMPMYIEKLLDFEEITYELAGILDDRAIVKRVELYRALRKRFEKLP